MMFPSFGCNTVYTFRILKPLKKVFRQNPVEAAVRRPAVGRPTWPNDRYKNLLFGAGNCWNYELWCFKKRKYYVLKLYQTRFFIFLHIKKRRPNPAVVGGVKTMSNKKGFRCRTVVIRSALDSPDLGRASKYPEHCDNTFRKNSSEPWSQKLH